MAITHEDEPPEPTSIRSRIIETPQEKRQRKMKYAEVYAAPFGGSFAAFMKAEASRQIEKDEKAAERH